MISDIVLTNNRKEKRKCLNPCFNGIWYLTYADEDGYTKNQNKS